MVKPQTVLETRNLTIRYGDSAAVIDVSLRIPAKTVTAIIGPSGCGKSTLLRALNRMNDLVSTVSVQGEALFHGKNLYASDVDPVELRQRIGMVFQKPNPFPKSIAKNISWAPLLNGYRGDVDELVEKSLRQAALWHEVKHKLNDSGLELSGGQQQRLCIARTLAMNPEVILLDEPCSALDPASTSRIEDLLVELAGRYTIVIVTHNMQQAARVSDYTAFLCDGRLVEFGPTDRVFTRPENSETEAYVTGKFG